MQRPQIRVMICQRLPPDDDEMALGRDAFVTCGPLLFSIADWKLNENKKKSHMSQSWQDVDARYK